MTAARPRVTQATATACAHLSVTGSARSEPKCDACGQPLSKWFKTTPGATLRVAAAESAANLEAIAFRINSYSPTAAMFLRRVARGLVDAGRRRARAASGTGTASTPKPRKGTRS